MARKRKFGAILRTRFEKALAEAGEDWVYTAGEETYLDLIEALANDIEKLEGLLAEEGLSVEGSAKQMKLNPVVTELRQSRVALAGLVDRLGLPDDEDGPDSPGAKSAAARALAMQRWQGG